MKPFKAEYEIKIKNRDITYKVKNRITDEGLYRYIQNLTNESDLLRYCILSPQSDELDNPVDVFTYTNARFELSEVIPTVKEDTFIAGESSLDEELTNYWPVFATRFVYEGVYSGDDNTIINSIGISWEQYGGQLFSIANIEPFTSSEVNGHLEINNGEEITIIYTLYTTSKTNNVFKTISIENNAVTQGKQCTVKTAFNNDPFYWGINKNDFNTAGCLAFETPAGSSDSCPAGVGVPATTVERLAIDIQTESAYQIKYKVTWNHEVANFTTGLKSILLSNSLGDGLAAYQIEFSEPLFKDEYSSFIFYFNIIFYELY